MGALEAPQDKHGQEHRTGTSRAEQTDKGGHGGAGSSGGHGGAGSSGGHGVARSPRPGPYSRNPFTPPNKKISLGKLGGIRSPPGLDTNKQDRTSHRNRFHLHDKRSCLPQTSLRGQDMTRQGELKCSCGHNTT